MSGTTWALLIVIGAGLAVGGLLAWMAFRDRRALIAGMLALIPGALAGAFILDQANQPGMASLNGAVASVALGGVAVVMVVVGLVVPRVRLPASSAAACLVLSAVFTSQLLVLLERI
jgi:hypothetical protein